MPLNMKVRIEKLTSSYNEMKVYGINNLIKEYAGFPIYLPGDFYSEHGWTPYNYHSISNLETTKKMFFVFSKRREEEWKKTSNLPVHNIGTPFIHFRRKNNINKSNGANGTVAFPAHSGTHRTSEFNYEQYGQELMNLPKRFHPISICMHNDDIKRGRHKRFSKFNFKILTAGDRFDPNFALNLYNILRNTKYTTSNSIGSYIFYAIEMDIPFFILGDEPTMVNHNKVIESIAPDKELLNQTPYGSICHQLFNTGPAEYITKEQLDFVIEETGMADCISRQELNHLLWKNYLKNNILKSAKAFVKYIILNR